MIMFLENPFAVVICTVVLLLITFYFWAQTRLKSILMLMAAFLILGVAMIVVERMVVTDREEIRNTMLEIAAVVDRDDVEGTMEFFEQDADSEEVRAKARRDMGRGKIRACRLKKIKKYDFDESFGNQKCEVELIASGDASRSGYNWRGALEFTLQLEEITDGDWRITDYSYRSALPKKAPRR